MENKKTAELHAQMKTAILDKSECMLDTYTSILRNTKHEIEKAFGKTIEPDELLRRTDMFFNLALQRTDKDITVAKQKDMAEKQKDVVMNRPVHNNMPSNSRHESPCAKKAREAAAKIATLEAEVIKSKDDRKSLG